MKDDVQNLVFEAGDDFGEDRINPACGVKVVADDVFSFIFQKRREMIYDLKTLEIHYLFYALEKGDSSSSALFDQARQTKKGD